MGLFEQYRAAYAANWQKMQIRPQFHNSVERTGMIILNNKPRYQAIEMQTKVKWWFTGLLHYRESDFNFDTYLGNGQSIHHVTTEVPAGRGPFVSFFDGAYDAYKIQGFLNLTDWSIERTSYREEGFNGYGYHAHGIPAPYLYGGSTLYGPPDGKFIRDHVFSSTVRDTQLGTLTILKWLEHNESSVAADLHETPPPATPPAETPEEAIEHAIRWVQVSLNTLSAAGLTVDGRLGKATMGAVGKWQKEHDEPITGLPDIPTIVGIANALPDNSSMPVAAGLMSMGRELEWVAAQPPTQEHRELLHSLYH